MSNTPTPLAVTGKPDADALLNRDPLALLLGMLLDQQVAMEWAFTAPFTLELQGMRAPRGECAQFAARPDADLRGSIRVKRTPAHAADFANPHRDESLLNRAAK